MVDDGMVNWNDRTSEWIGGHSGKDYGKIQERVEVIVECKNPGPSTWPAAIKIPAEIEIGALQQFNYYKFNFI